MSSLLATWLITHWLLCRCVYICVCISLLSRKYEILFDLQPCFWPQVMHLQRAAVGREALCPMHPSSIHGVEDMSTLAELHEAAIMHNLFLRYQKDNIYVSRIPEEILILLQNVMLIFIDLMLICFRCCSSITLHFFTNYILDSLS